jgi:hypothetical protein
VAGAAAWIAGYVLTAIVVVTNQSPELQEIAENVDGDAGGFEFVGWVFFNEHFVDTILRADFLGFGGSRAVSFIGGDGFTPLLYVVPIALLAGAGLAIGRSQGVTETGEGALSGALVVPPYLVLSVIGAYLFRVSTEALGASFSGEPELLSAILLAGIVFPAVFGALGGIVAANTASDR